MEVIRAISGVKAGDLSSNDAGGDVGGLRVTEIKNSRESEKLTVRRAGDAIADHAEEAGGLGPEARELEGEGVAAGGDTDASTLEERGNVSDEAGTTGPNGEGGCDAEDAGGGSAAEGVGEEVKGAEEGGVGDERIATGEVAI